MTLKPKHFLEYAVPKETYTPSVYDGNPEPPYPDLDEDIKTLEGIDADKDGLRDDLEIWINRISKDQNIRQLLRIKATFLFEMMKKEKTKENGISLFVTSTRLSGCESLIENGESKNLSYNLNKNITNTKERRVQIETIHNMALPRHTALPSPQEIIAMADCFCDFRVVEKDELIERYQVKNNLVNLSKFKMQYIFNEITKRGERGSYEKDFGIRDYKSCLDIKVKPSSFKNYSEVTDHV